MSEQIVIVVTGGRGWEDADAVHSKIGESIFGKKEAVLFHGACPTGADAMAEKAAELRGITVHRFAADWKEHGRRAGPIRNEQMCEAARALAALNQAEAICLAFWDGKSPGTLNCISRATQAGIAVHITPKEVRR